MSRDSAADTAKWKKHQQVAEQELSAASILYNQQLEAVLIQHIADFKAKDAQIGELQTEVRENGLVQQGKDHLEDNYKFIEKEQEATVKKIEHLQGKNCRLAKSSQDLRRDISAAAQELEHVQQGKKELEKKYENLKKSYSASREITHLEKKHSTATREVEQTKQGKKRFEETYETVERDHRAAIAQNSKLIQSSNEKDINLKALQEQTGEALARKDEDIRNLTGIKGGLESSYTTLEKRNKDLEQDLVKAEETVSKARQKSQEWNNVKGALSQETLSLKLVIERLKDELDLR